MLQFCTDFSGFYPDSEIPHSPIGIFPDTPIPRRGQTSFDAQSRQDEILGTLISLCCWFQFLSE
jgi:hypothetical protein